MPYCKAHVTQIPDTTLLTPPQDHVSLILVSHVYIVLAGNLPRNAQTAWFEKSSAVAVFVYPRGRHVRRQLIGDMRGKQRVYVLETSILAL